MPDTTHGCAASAALRQLEEALATTRARLHVERVESVERQIGAARSDVLVVRDDESAVIVVTGDDRVTWLNGLVTCDVAKLAVGAAQYGLAVNQKGRIVCDLFVVSRVDRLEVIVPARARDELMTALGRYLVMEDAEMARADDLAVWFAHGPRALEIAKPFDGVPFDRTGFGGAIIIAKKGDAVTGGVVGDDAGWDALRIERGLPRFGVDFDAKTYPQEASLEKSAVSFDKGCYLGQEVVCMLELRGHVKRKLVPFSIESGSVVSGATITDDAGAEIGKVSSAVANAGLAMVKLAHATSGALLRAGEAKLHVK